MVKTREKTPADNERFYESGGVCPQKHLCKFASASPARTFASPRLHKAAGRYRQAAIAQRDNEAKI
jgi:hypothetical protein